MEKLLKNHLRSVYDIYEENTNWQYAENVNNDVLTKTWLDNYTSFIYKVGVLCAIDNNKCDWVYVAIAIQRSEISNVEIIGNLHFSSGENDDMGNVIKRAYNLLKYIHPAFE